MIIEKNSRINKIKKLTQYEGHVTVRRPVYSSRLKHKVKKYTLEKIDVKDILPGDVVKIENDSIIFFDGVLVKGTCLIDESLLTGESIPVSKTALPRDKNEVRPANLLYCGSKCLIVREKEVYALVLTTNWNTFKGKIIGSLVYSKTPNSLMKKEVLAFIKWGTIGCLIFLFFLILNDYMNGKIHFKRVMTHFVDVLDTGIQPTVIFIFQVTFVVVGSKLENRKIHLLDGDKLFEAGRIQTVCFDKTGTLTQNKMKLFGVVINNSNSPRLNQQEENDRVKTSLYKSLSMSIDKKTGSNNTDHIRQKFDNVNNLFFHPNQVDFGFIKKNTEPNTETNLPGASTEFKKESQSRMKMSKIPDDNYYSFVVMGCCHDLHNIEGEVLGDPIETEMFKFTDFRIKELEFEEAKSDDLEGSPEEQTGLVGEVANPSTRMLFSTRNLKQTLRKNRRDEVEESIDNMFKNIPKISPTKKFKKAYQLDDDFEFRIIRISPFNSVKKRMSVLVYARGEFLLVTKGAAETLIGLSRQQTIPFESQNLLMRFGQQGMKTLGMAFKKIDISLYLDKLEEKYPLQVKEIYKMLENETLGEKPNAKRVLQCLDKELMTMLFNLIDFEKEEQNLHFLGFIILRNPLKPNAHKTIKTLNFNFINCKMVTGDNLYTSLNVARFSGIIPKQQSVWVGQYSKLYQQIEWRLFNFSKKSLGQDLSGQSVSQSKGDLSHFAGISKISPKGQFISNVNASHVTRSVMVEHSENAEKNSNEDFSAELDLISKMDEVEESFEVKKQKMTLGQLMRLDQRKNVCMALDGKSMDTLIEQAQLDPIKTDFIFTKTSIFARTTPDQKRIVVEGLKAIEAREKKTVAFVGDGSNDCKALNKANVGLALGNNEASVSSSLVTSSEDIGKIIDVITLGKFSLNNMFEVFVMNNGLSFVEMTCYFYLIYNDYYFMNWKYVIETLVFTQFAFFLTFGQSNKLLNRFYPTAGILNWQTMVFLLGQFVFTGLVVSAGFILYRHQFFYKEYDDIFGEEPFTDLELHFTTDSMLMSFLFAFISVGYVLGLYTGFPYKRSVFFEFFFLIYIVFLVILNFIAIKPEFFSSSFGFQEFWIYYARTPDIEHNFFMRWLGLAFLSGFMVYFSGRAFRYYAFSEELTEIKRKITRRRRQRKKMGYPLDDAVNLGQKIEETSLSSVKENKI